MFYKFSDREIFNVEFKFCIFDIISIKKTFKKLFLMFIFKDMIYDFIFIFFNVLKLS